MLQGQKPGYTQISVGRETEALVLKPRALPFWNSGGFPKGPGGSGDPGERPLFLRGQFWDGEEEYKSAKEVLATELVVPQKQPESYLSPLQTGSVPPPPNLGSGSGAEHPLRVEVGKGW